MNIPTFRNESIASTLEALRRPVTDTAKLEATVNEVFSAVKNSGDSAVLEYTLKFDKASISNLIVGPEEIAAAATQVSQQLKDAINQAILNVDLFHTSQLAEIGRAHV